jgi:hypothetical protein
MPDDSYMTPNLSSYCSEDTLSLIGVFDTRAMYSAASPMMTMVTTIVMESKNLDQ